MEEVKFKYGTINFQEIDNYFLLNDIEIKPYQGEEAVRDTAFAVRNLRNKGIIVLGIFSGNEEDVGSEKKIYGKDFDYIRELRSFSNVVGRYLKRQIESEE